MHDPAGVAPKVSKAPSLKSYSLDLMTDGISFGKNMLHIYVLSEFYSWLLNTLFCAPRNTVGLSIDVFFFAPSNQL